MPYCEIAYIKARSDQNKWYEMTWYYHDIMHITTRSHEINIGEYFICVQNKSLYT